MNPQSKDSKVSGQYSFRPGFSKDNTDSSSSVNISPTSSNETENEQEVHTSSPDPSLTSDKKSPPQINQKLMSDLKTVKIDRTQYRHYGHQSSMTSQSLEKIISEGKKKEEEEQRRKKEEEEAAEQAKKKTEHESKTSEPSRDIPQEAKSKKSETLKLKIKREPRHADEETSNSAPTSSSSSGMHLQISDLLNIEAKDSTVPYSTETINEILKLKTEQEITKQEEIKNEIASTTLELLKMAQTLKISPDLIPFLFLSNRTADNLRKKVQTLQTDPSILVKQIESDAQSHFKHGSSSSLPSFSEFGKPPAQLKFTSSAGGTVVHSNIESPIRSPNRSPVLSHRKNRSDSTNNDNSPQLTNPKPVLLPLPTTNYSSQQQQQQLQQAQYPLYYTSPAGPGVETKYLGSPYTQKKQSQVTSQQSSPPASIVYPNQAQAPGQATAQQQSQSQYYVAQKPQQYQYYVATTPPQGSQYVMHPVGVQYQPPPPGMATQVPQYIGNNAVPVALGPAGPASSHPSIEVEKSKVPGGGSILRFDKDEPEDQPPTKKSKPTQKSSNINFMITTPENPPAKKYNNSRS